MPEDLSAYDGIEMRVKGDGHRYKLILRTSSDWDTVGYTASFDTVRDQWQTVSSPSLRYILFNDQLVGLTVPCWIQIKLPFSSFRPVFRARTVVDAAPFDSSNIISLQACFLCSLAFIFVIINPPKSVLQPYTAHVQQVWVWWETQSYFWGRIISASIFKHTSVH